MILSASRRTDIPNYYSDWFLNRIKEGVVYVRNPVHLQQVSKIKLTPDIVDCIVFWTKNPEPMLDKLRALDGYPYYFQFTITPYGEDIEPHVPEKKQRIIEIFQNLSARIGKERVIWRYDPILLNHRYTVEFHTAYFGFLAEKLHLCTETCIISFLDIYRKIKQQAELVGMKAVQDEQKRVLAQNFIAIARQFGLQIKSCAEVFDLQDIGVGHANCIDAALVERITGSKIKAVKDKNQRPVCGCAASIDIGLYHTCPNGCKYCYANADMQTAKRQFILHNKTSPLLCGRLLAGDQVIERNVKSWKTGQVELF